MRKVEFKKWYQLPVNVGEQNSGEVITQPDMALSPADILRLFQMGRSSDLPAKEAVYNGSEEVVNIEKMDAIERSDYARGLLLKLNGLRSEKQELEEQYRKTLAELDARVIREQRQQPEDVNDLLKMRDNSKKE